MMLKTHPFRPKKRATSPPEISHFVTRDVPSRTLASMTAMTMTVMTVGAFIFLNRLLFTEHYLYYYI